MSRYSNEVVEIIDSHVIVAFIRHTNATEEVWCKDYLCIPLNATTTWWTDSKFIHAQVAFKVRLSGGKRQQPEETLMTFSVDSKRKKVSMYANKNFTDEYAWEFMNYNLNKTGVRKSDGAPVRQIERAYQFCEDQVGKPARIVGMLASGLCGFSGNRNSYFCTELVLEMFHEVGELNDVSAVSTSPGTLYNILSTKCSKRGSAYTIPHPRTFSSKEIEF